MEGKGRAERRRAEAQKSLVEPRDHGSLDSFLSWRVGDEGREERWILVSSRSEKSLSTSQNALGKSLLGVSITSCRHSGEGINVAVRNMICLQGLEELASISHDQDFLT